ncbi:MAG: AAA family ATPase [Sulfurimonas sp.]
MELLEYFHSQHYSSEKYIPRKLHLPEKRNINLFGVRGAGKTSMVLAHIDDINEEERLYIDLEDPNLIFERLNAATLQQYIDQYGITLLILDQYEQGYLERFPNVDRLIVISRIPLHDPQLIPVELFPLDYEEFLAFESSISATNAFNHFLKSGTLPALAKSYRATLEPMKRFWQSHFTSNEQKLLLILAQHHTKHLTTHQIYQFAKERFRVSKDWLYKTIKTFTEEKLIHFVNDRYQKGGKKMILCDFAFAKYLTTGQPFITQFDTMIALALLKHNIDFDTLGIHGYITKEGELIIPAPFESEESLWAKSQTKFSLYKQHKVKKITIVTVANSYEYDIEKLHFEALPFYEWTVLYDEEEE